MTAAKYLEADGRRPKRFPQNNSNPPTTVFRFKMQEFFRTVQKLFLLPAGEGQDEGERVINL